MKIRNRHIVDGVVVLRVLLSDYLAHVKECDFCCYSNNAKGSFAGRCDKGQIRHVCCNHSDEVFITKASFRGLSTDYRKAINHTQWK